MTVIYQQRRPFSLIFSVRGTALPVLLPYIFFSCLITYVVWYLKYQLGWPITFPPQGHSFLAIVLAFLVVNRTSTSYSRYWEARTLLGRAFNDVRKVSVSVASCTSSDVSEGAATYRRDIADVLERLVHSTVDILCDELRCRTLTTEGPSPPPPRFEDYLYSTIQRESAAELPEDKAEDDPMTNVLNALTVVENHAEFLVSPFPPPTVGGITSPLLDYVEAYGQLVKFMTDPYPFMLVQMTVSLLFIWTYTLPFSLLHVSKELIPSMVCMALVTYGFGGLMSASSEMSHPFGDDPNDIEIKKLMSVTIAGLRRDLGP